MLNAAIISAIEEFAPASLQESWDNTGVQVGSLRTECTGVMLCVDVTPAVVNEAHERGCNLIISHHPLIFRGLKRISGNTPVEESVILAIRYGITIYSSHTATDSTYGGISYRMAEMLGAKPVKVLSAAGGLKTKIKVTAKVGSERDLSTIFEEASADVTVVFNNATSTKSIGEKNDVFGTTEIVSTPCITAEALVETSAVGNIQNALMQTLGERLLSTEVQSITNKDTKVGLGVYALFDEAISAVELIERVKKVFNSPIARCTALPDDDVKINRIALCGGSGGEFISTALRCGAQAYITSDTRYHDFVDYQNQILIIDIGHFESESCSKEIFYDVISKKFPNFACYKSQIEENSIKYL